VIHNLVYAGGGFGVCFGMVLGSCMEIGVEMIIDGVDDLIVAVDGVGRGGLGLVGRDHGCQGWWRGLAGRAVILLLIIIVLWIF
jgi:hypothetical protein